MAGAKEIRTKIKSIKSTQKITRAMEMVAASKMRKAQDRMMATRPYSERIQAVADHIATAQLEYQHPYVQMREEKRIGLIVVSSDRGLCGGLNANLFRRVLNDIKSWQDEGCTVSVCTMGTKAQAFFKRLGLEVKAKAQRFGDAPTVEEVIGPVQVMLSAYLEDELDALYVVYNTFVNTMSQKPTVKRLLPVTPSEEVKQTNWDYLYEPKAEPLIQTVLDRYIEMQVFQGVVENFACEQSARMVAMKSASDNAKSLIDSLQLVYNKARQAAITQELSEIVSGAAAV